MAGLVKAMKKNNTYSGEYDDVLFSNEPVKVESVAEEEVQSNPEGSETLEEEIMIDLAQLMTEAQQLTVGSVVKMNVLDKLRKE